MTKDEIIEIREHLTSIRVNCEAAIEENPADEYAQSNWQHVTAALDLLRVQKGNHASADNGRKGGRPRVGVARYADAEIRSGAESRTLFCVSKEGGVYRRRPASAANDYGLYGRLAVNTRETQEEVIRRLRAARASVNRTRAIIEEYNRELLAK